MLIYGVHTGLERGGIFVMTKIQKCEWAALAGMILAFPVLLWVAIDNLDLVGMKDTSPAEVITFLVFFGFALFYLVSYTIRIISDIVKKTMSFKLVLVRIIAPILIVIATAALVNGATPFNEEFSYLNVFTVAGVVLACIVYNVFFFFYWGTKHMYVSLVLFNIAAWAIALKGLGVSYVHNYYLECLIPALCIGYLEYFIRTRRSRA